jgi:glycosyltransferase domain-containing protein
MLKDITIVVITFERYGYLKRLLSFYLSYNSEAKFLILDSSSYDPEDKELIEMLSNKCVSWKRFSPETFFLRKIAEGSSFIETKYSVLSADDDFLIPTAIEECKSFLEDNKDFCSAQGLSFLHFKGGFLSSGLRVEPPNKGIPMSLEDKSPFDRLKKYMNGESEFYPFYAVHRSRDFIKIWTYAREYVDHQGLSELLPSCLSIASGKMKVMDNFYNLREANDFNNWEDESTQKEVYSKKRVSKASQGLSEFLGELNYSMPKSTLDFCDELFKNYLMLLKDKRNEIKKNHKFINKILVNLRAKLRVRSRLKELFNLVLNRASHSHISPNYIADFKKVERIIILSGLDSKELNRSRAKVKYKTT